MVQDKATRRSQHKINIAIDGYSSCGKGTLAKALAKHLDYIFIDSGAMYRAVTLHMMRMGVDVLNETAVMDALQGVTLSCSINKQKQTEIILNGKGVESEIRGLLVASKVSEVAKILAVRNKLVAIQQEIGMNKGVVMDGRDIGTVVFPQAEVKIFMTANSAVRANRRFEELIANGDAVSLETVRKNLEHRDSIDESREHSPLSRTSDYCILDNSDLSKEKQLEIALKWVNDALNSANS
ncbi:MAG: (d)CMP kinase [Flavobacteriaceae bacterium]|nr:(d)CMP kinase [Flavobacteriaceae bacterium]